MAPAGIRVFLAEDSFLSVIFAGLAWKLSWTMWINNLENFVAVEMSEIVINPFPRGSEGRRHKTNTCPAQMKFFITCMSPMLYMVIINMNSDACYTLRHLKV